MQLIESTHALKGAQIETVPWEVTIRAQLAG